VASAVSSSSGALVLLTCCFAVYFPFLILPHAGTSATYFPVRNDVSAYLYSLSSFFLGLLSLFIHLFLQSAPFTIVRRVSSLFSSPSSLHSLTTTPFLH